LGEAVGGGGGTPEGGRRRRWRSGRGSGAATAMGASVVRGGGGASRGRWGPAGELEAVVGDGGHGGRWRFVKREKRGK
jgi:hypothetical protein